MLLQALVRAGFRYADDARERLFVERFVTIHVRISQVFLVMSGSMFCLFFTGQPVRNLDEARRADTGRFARFFHALLKHGVYVAPSQFETGFISAAHSADDIGKTAQAMRAALAR